MGAICCSETKNDERKLTMLTSIEERPRFPGKSTQSKFAIGSNNNDFSSRDLFRLVPLNEIEENIEKSKSILENPAIDIEENLFINENIRAMATPLKLWVMLSDLPSGCKLHNYYSKLRFPLTPDFMTLFSMNLTQDIMKKIDDNIDSFEVLDYSFDSERALFVTRTTTKKILIVSSKSFLVLRSLERLENGNVLEYQKSIELTSLNSDEIYKSEVQKLINPGKIIFGSELLEFNGVDTLRNTLTTIDVNSAVTMRLMQSMIRNRIRTYNENLFRQMVEYLVKTNEFEDIIWFPDCKVSKISQIFKQNLTLLKQSGIILDFLDAKTYDVFKSKIANVESKIVEVQDEENLFKEDKNVVKKEESEKLDISDDLTNENNGHSKSEFKDPENKNEGQSNQIEKFDQELNKNLTNSPSKSVNQQNYIAEDEKSNIIEITIVEESTNSQKDQSVIAPLNCKESEIPVENTDLKVQEDPKPWKITNKSTKKNKKH
jgi:hypothetical protein